MNLLRRFATTVGLAGAALTASGVAWGWVETSITSHAVNVQVERSGKAVVSQELAIRVRGGPFRDIEIAGVDSDAEPVAGATIESTRPGAQAKSLPVLVSRGDDDSLRLEIESEKGLRSGTYLLRVGYHTNLRARGLLRRRGSWIELDWVGPRLDSGLDAAKVTLNVPSAAILPRLPELDRSDEMADLAGLSGGAILSSTRRGATTDAIDLVRPHVARGEPVLWRVWVSPDAFDPLATKPSLGSSQSTAPARSLRLEQRLLPLVVGLTLAAAFATLMLLKHRRLAIDAAQEQVKVRALVPLAPIPRAALAALLLAFGFFCALRLDEPSLGAVALAAVLVLGAYRTPRMSRAPRGPGRWLPITSQEAFAVSARRSKTGWLDASCAKGRLVLGLWTLACVVAIALGFRRDAYQTLLFGLAMPLPWPLLLTGRSADLPSNRRRQAQRLLGRLYRSLLRQSELRVAPMGRFPTGSSQFDELRLRVIPRHAKAGLVGIEAVCETDAWASPELAVLVRALKGSAAARCMAGWENLRRGRNATEQVAVLTPRLPGLWFARRLVGELARDLSDAPLVAFQSSPSKQSRRSPGKGSVTSKPGMSAVPDQANRQACSPWRPGANPGSGAAP